MRQMLEELPIRGILIVSIILGSMAGGFGSIGQEVIEGPTCTTQAPGCTIEGCHNSRPDGSGYTVCLYSGTNCPPLTQCQ